MTDVELLGLKKQAMIPNMSSNPCETNLIPISKQAGLERPLHW